MNREEVKHLLGKKDFTNIYERAFALKRDLYSDDVYIRCIIEFSNHCRADCAYCGLNCNNRSAQRYRMEPEEIISTAKTAWEAGYQTAVLQSGEDLHYTKETVGEIVREIKRTGMCITLSIGERSFEEYEHWRECGADRYLLKHETSDSTLYEELHTYSTFENRLKCLRELKSLGYETGSGFMIGLPGQTLGTVADDIMLLADIPCDMAGIGPFVPHPSTPLKDTPSGSTELTKRAIALTRILMGRINLPATTSLGVLSKEAKDNVFACGANVIMKKVTPDRFKRLYEIYPSKLSKTDIVKERKETEEQLRALGCTPV